MGNQCQNLFNRELLDKVVSKKMWKSMLPSERRFILKLYEQWFPFNKDQNKVLNKIIKEINERNENEN